MRRMLRRPARPRAAGTTRTGTTLLRPRHAGGRLRRALACAAAMTAAPLGWLGIVRLGLVQTALGAIVVLTTST